jgi:predicted RNA binding protein YcfA (HicA-like mRNA interferase family)
MAILPALNGREVVKIFEADGWRIARQRGSHIILVKDKHIATLSVPEHREVAKGTLRSLIRASGLTPDEFIAKDCDDSAKLPLDVDECAALDAIVTFPADGTVRVGFLEVDWFWIAGAGESGSTTRSPTKTAAFAATYFREFC